MKEIIRGGNISETCRRYGIAPKLYYRWKDEAEQGAKAALGGRSAAAAKTEKTVASGNWNEPIEFSCQKLITNGSVVDATDQ